MSDREAVRWLSDPRATKAPCVVCGNASGNSIILSARHWDASQGYLDFATCGRCGSGFYCDIAAHRDYPEAEQQKLANPEFVLLLYHYLEFACGIGSIVDLLERSPFERVGSFLEVGCNMGIALDYVRTNWKVDAVGVEPSAYGLGGRKLLDLPITAAYLDDVADLRARSFDMVFASEVLEHVFAPAELLQSMKRRLSASGYLMLTTPTIDAVARDAPPGEMLGALSAGAHYFVASERGLVGLLRASGLERFHVERSGPSHAVVAGPGAVALKRPRRTVSARLYSYYRHRIEVRCVEPRVELAFLLHAYDAGVDSGASDAVRHLEPKIDRLLAELFELSLDAPRALADRIAPSTNLFELGRRMPYSLPRHLHARAASLRRADRHRGELLAAAALVAAHGVEVDLMNLPGYVRIHRRARAAARGAVVTGAATPTALALLEESEAIADRAPALAHRGWTAGGIPKLISRGLLQAAAAAVRWRSGVP